MNASLQIPALSFKKTTLPNGLDVIVRRQGDMPIVAVNLWYHVGSKDEQRTQRGFAHLFEHLMFEGSAHYPGDYFKPLQRLGATINGSTSSDRTNYFVDLPIAHLELGLAMESDRMGHFLAALSDEKIRIQKDVVKNEYRQNYANRSYGQAWRIIAEAMYPPDHPYSWLTIGAMEDVEAASRGDVESFFQRYYVPSNSSLAIVGDIDEDDAICLASRYFGDIPGGMAAALPWTPSIGSPRPCAELRYFDRVELDRLYLVWHSTPQFSNDDAPLSLLSDILTRSRSSRLYQSLVVREGLAQDVSSYQSGRELGGAFAVTVTLRPGRSWEAVSARILAEIAAIARDGVTQEELARVQNGRLAGFIYALDDVGGFGGVADRLNAYNVYLGDPARITTDLRRYQEVRGDDLRHTAASYLVDKTAVRLVVQRKPAVATLDRGVPPVSAPSAPFKAPTPDIVQLACGAQLWVIPRRDLPIVALSCTIRAGASVHGPEFGGLASLTADLIDEGTNTRESYDIGELAANMGTHLTSSAGWDGCYVGMQCLTSHLEASLDLTFDILQNPSFPLDHFDRIKGQTLAALKADRENAASRAHRAFLSVLYPETHPYHVGSDGTEISVTRLGRENLADFHQAHYIPERAVIVVAGDVDSVDIARRLNERLTGWKRRENGSLVTPAAVERLKKGRTILVDRPGAEQAVIRLGNVGTDRLDPDYNDLVMFNQILGGQFSSRLNTKLREEKGFTYGIRSGFDFRRGAGPFSVSASIQSDRVAEALVDIRQEIVSLFSDRPPTETELSDARRALIEGQARHFETPAVLASRFATLFLYGLPPDHYRGLADRLNAVSVDSMVAAARRWIVPESFTTVVVADAASVATDLERLGLGDFEVWNEMNH